MFCSKCGKEVTGEPQFCPYCGAKMQHVAQTAEEAQPAEQAVAEPVVEKTPETVVETKQEPEQAPVQEVPVQSVPVEVVVDEGGDGAQKKKVSFLSILNKFKFVFIGVAALIICAVVLIIVLNNRKTAINLNDYVTVEFNGYNGYGTARASIDKDKFIEDNKDKLPDFMSVVKGMSKAAKANGAGDLFDGADQYMGLVGAYASTVAGDQLKEYTAELLYEVFFPRSGELDETQDLSNGDTVTYEWTIADSIDQTQMKIVSDVFKVKVSYEDMPFVVSELEEVPEFDPFEGVEVSFDGTAPSGSAYFSDYPYNGLSYSLDKNTNLKNGDEVKVTVSYGYSEGFENYVRDYGKMPSKTEKTFIVSGLSEYVSEISQIDDETLRVMQNQVEDILEASTTSWVEGFELDPQCIGKILLTAKDPDTWNAKNRLILVYKLHYANDLEVYRNDDEDVEDEDEEEAEETEESEDEKDSEDEKEAEDEKDSEDEKESEDDKESEDYKESEDEKESEDDKESEDAEAEEADEEDDSAALEFDYYYYVSWDNLSLSDGDVIFNLTSYSKPSERFEVSTGITYSSWWSTEEYKLYFEGYDNYDKFYNACVTANKENYKVEEDITEE